MSADIFTIEVKNLPVRAYHGVFAFEREEGNDFLVSVSIDYPALLAAEHDDVEKTLNYAELCDIIHREMLVTSQLLEAVCLRIKRSILARWPEVVAGRVRVQKLNPPIPDAEKADVSVALSW